MRPIPLLALALACTPADGPDDDTGDTAAAPTTEDLVATWANRGPSRVGYDTGSLTYADPIGGSDRTLALAVWYPTPDTDGAVATFTGPHACDDCLTGATVADGTFPLAVFTHGHQGNTDNATHLMAWLASHGWVVVAPEHTGNTLADGDARDTEIYAQRPGDVSATLDHVLGGDSLLGDRADGERVLLLGHSFGGFTAYLVAGAQLAVDHWAPLCTGDSTNAFCTTWTEELAAKMDTSFLDERVDAVVTLSGGNFGQVREEGFATVSLPLMQMTGALDGSVPNEGESDLTWAALPAGDRVRVDFAHGDHQTYMDFAGAGGGLLPGTSADALDQARGHRATYVYAGAWAARHVLGTGGPAVDPVLDGTFEVKPDVTVSVKDD